jgi:hypothetical protein
MSAEAHRDARTDQLFVVCSKVVELGALISACLQPGNMLLCLPPFCLSRGCGIECDLPFCLGRGCGIGLGLLMSGFDGDLALPFGLGFGFGLLPGGGGEALAGGIGLGFGALARGFVGGGLGYVTLPRGLGRVFIRTQIVQPLATGLDMHSFVADDKTVGSIRLQAALYVFTHCV